MICASYYAEHEHHLNHFSHDQHYDRHNLYRISLSSPIENEKNAHFNRQKPNSLHR